VHRGLDLPGAARHLRAGLAAQGHGLSRSRTGRRRITIGGGINAFLGVLGWYWVFGWLLISGTVRPVYPLPDTAWFALCVSLCMLGCASS
jgi:hypothetical protein